VSHRANHYREAGRLFLSLGASTISATTASIWTGDHYKRTMVLRYGSLALRQRREMWPIFRESLPYLASTELGLCGLETRDQQGKRRTLGVKKVPDGSMPDALTSQRCG
jgi:hypothetical protein